MRREEAERVRTQGVADTSETLPARCTRGHSRDTSLALHARARGASEDAASSSRRARARLPSPQLHPARPWQRPSVCGRWGRARRRAARAKRRGTIRRRRRRSSARRAPRRIGETATHEARGTVATARNSTGDASPFRFAAAPGLRFPSSFGVPSVGDSAHRRHTAPGTKARGSLPLLEWAWRREPARGRSV